MVLQAGAEVLGCHPVSTLTSHSPLRSVCSSTTLPRVRVHSSAASEDEHAKPSEVSDGSASADASASIRASVVTMPPPSNRHTHVTATSAVTASANAWASVAGAASD